MQEAEDHLKRSDKPMSALVERVGPCGLSYHPPTFESLARSIVYQQISIHAARSIYARLTQNFGVQGTLHPERLAVVGPEDLRACGLSLQKAKYILDLATKSADGSLDFERLPALSDEEVIAELCKVKGIGVWTAQMFLMFSLKRLDVLPTGDLGIRNAVKKLYRLPELPNPVQLEKRARKWRPYSTVACWYLWRSLEPDGPF